MKYKTIDQISIHVMYITIIIILILLVAWRQSVVRKWEKRAFKTLELYHEVCEKHNEYIKYIP